MLARIPVALLVFISLLGKAVGIFDWRTANTSLWLSAAAYCETNTYLRRTYKGYSAGFVATSVIDNPERDVQAFVGYMPAQATIYTSFRGSSSIEDWLNNFDILLTDYPLCSGCEVHKGFYDAQQSVAETVLRSVQTLRQRFPNYTVVVTGHSLGGAMATLTAIDLKEHGIPRVRLFNFGSPRVGNHDFAEWASTYLPDRNRVTHHRDAIVHVPPHQFYMHISGEWYEDQNHVVRQCTGYEDRNCSYQWRLTNLEDHTHYLNLTMDCGPVS